jgi:hypothetical protein
MPDVRVAGDSALLVDAQGAHVTDAHVREEHRVIEKSLVDIGPTARVRRAHPCDPRSRRRRERIIDSVWMIGAARPVRDRIGELRAARSVTGTLQRVPTEVRTCVNGEVDLLDGVANVTDPNAIMFVDRPAPGAA